ncbi:MAG: hypothetical protein PW786_02500 [Arachidicoccus sp.]|nr:hypothetical protein [Arachidicoccus sp.]
MPKTIRSIFISGLLLFISLNLFSQDLKYATKNIPSLLRENANSVVREESEQFMVKDAGDAVYNDHSVITILNAKAKRYLTFSDHTSRFDKLTDASVVVYDSNGTKLKTYSLKDMTLNNYGGEFVDDGKFYSFSVTPTVYPITIEVNYTEKFSGILNYPVRLYTKRKSICRKLFHAGKRSKKYRSSV